MNTPNTPPRSPAIAASVFHSSSRTSVAINRDVATGWSEERLTMSRLQMSWEVGAVQIRFTASDFTTHGRDRAGVRARRK